MQEVFRKVSKEEPPVSSALSQLYTLPRIFHGNAENGVKVVHYSGGNWADILSGLGSLGVGVLSAGGVVKGNAVNKLSQSYQVGGSIQIGGAVIHVDGSNNRSGSSTYFVIGRNVSSNFSTYNGNADGLIIDTDKLDENGFFKGSRAYKPPAQDSIPSYTDSASVKIMRADGERRKVIIPVVRPAIPAAVRGEYGNITEVQRPTLLNILQSKIINYFNFLLQTSPITTNPKTLTSSTVYKRTVQYSSFRRCPVRNFKAYHSTIRRTRKKLFEIVSYSKSRMAVITFVSAHTDMLPEGQSQLPFSSIRRGFSSIRKLTYILEFCFIFLEEIH